MKIKPFFITIIALFPVFAWAQMVPNGGGANVPVSPGTNNNSVLTGPAGVSYSLGQLLSSSNIASGVFNLSAAQLPHWRQAVAGVRNGTSRGRIVFMGDSTTTGFGAGSSGAYNEVGAYAKAYPQAFASILSAHGISTFGYHKQHWHDRSYSKMGKLELY